MCFSYIATATTVKERTTAISLFSLAGSTAFVLGPGHYISQDINILQILLFSFCFYVVVIQLAFTPLGVGTDLPIGGDLYINLFTGPSWLSATMALINGLIFLPCTFTEFSVAKREGDFLARMAAKKKTAKAASPSPKEMAQKITKPRSPNKWTLVVCIIIFASVQFNFIFLERLISTSLS